MESKEEILNNLAQFCGTENWYKFSPFSKLVMTDGVKYLADKCQCYWLLDILVSVQGKPEIKREEFQVLLFNAKTMMVTIENGNKKVVYSQLINSTDFPLDKIEIWCANGVVYLPSEH